MRYLYDKDTTTYETLLAAMKVVELEWQECRGQYRVKGAVVSGNKELEDLKERMDKLQVTVKSASSKNEKDKKEDSQDFSSERRPKKDVQGTTTLSSRTFPTQPETHAVLQVPRMGTWLEGMCD